MSDDSRQRFVGCRACLNVHCRLPRSVLFGLRCIHVSARERRVFHSPCTNIVDCHLHCDRFSLCFGYRNFGIYKLSVLRSCPYYTSYHFNFTTTKNLLCLDTLSSKNVKTTDKVPSYPWIIVSLKTSMRHYSLPHLFRQTNLMDKVEHRNCPDQWI